MQRRPRLLDLFCKAGGAARGYQLAGYEVVGVDYERQPRYAGDHFVLGHAIAVMDVLLCGGTIVDQHGCEFRLSDFDAVHASPPCQLFTSLKAMWNRREHPDLIAPTRELLQASGLPYVIENVPGAPLLHGVILCGSMFRLGCEGAELRRHRVFETSFPMMVPSSCVHGWSGRGSATVGVYGHAGGYSHRQRWTTIGGFGDHGDTPTYRKNGQHFATALRAR